MILSSLFEASINVLGFPFSEEAKLGFVANDLIIQIES